jgi:hypothetical protein
MTNTHNSANTPMIIAHTKSIVHNGRIPPHFCAHIFLATLLSSAIACRKSRPNNPASNLAVVDTAPTPDVLPSQQRVPSSPPTPTRPSVPQSNRPLSARSFSVSTDDPRTTEFSPTYALSMVSDGSSSTYWSSQAAPAFPLSMILQLRRPSTVSSMVLNTVIPGYASSGAREIRLEYSSAASPDFWMPAYNGIAAENAVSTLQLDPPVIASRLRVVVESNYGGPYAAISEIQLLGPEEQSAPSEGVPSSPSSAQTGDSDGGPVPLNAVGVAAPSYPDIRGQWTTFFTFGSGSVLALQVHFDQNVSSYTGSDIILRGCPGSPGRCVVGRAVNLADPSDWGTIRVGTFDDATGHILTGMYEVGPRENNRLATFSFDFSADGNSFQGTWTQGEAGPGAGKMVGASGTK